MRILKNIFLGILLLILIASSVGLILVGWHVVPQAHLQTFVNVIYSVPANTWILTLVAVVLFVMCLIAIFGGGKKNREKKSAASASALIRASDIGAAYIALSALDTMVQKCVRSNQRIKDCTSRVVSDDNCIAIHLKLSLMPDTNVVELTETVQTELKNYIETLTGIIVREIHILIDSVNINVSSRVG